VLKQCLVARWKTVEDMSQLDDVVATQIAGGGTLFSSAMQAMWNGWVERVYLVCILSHIACFGDCCERGKGVAVRVDSSSFILHSSAFVGVSS